MRRLERIILLCALLLANTAVPARSLEELEHALARTPPVTTAFVEYRFSHLLKKPLRTGGSLEYRSDGVLARIVDAPYREVTEVDGDTVRITRAGKPTRTISMERAPQLRVILGSFRALLDGRLTPLKDDFEVTFAEQDARWALTLKPREPRLARRLARIEVYGAGDRPVCVEALEPDGDGALTWLGEAPASDASLDRAGLEQRCRASAAGTAATGQK
jgi:hypothetical protein